MRYSSASIVMASGKSPQNGGRLRVVSWLGLLLALFAFIEGAGCGDLEVPQTCDVLCIDSNNLSDKCQTECPATALCIKMCDCYGCSDEEEENCIYENDDVKVYADNLRCQDRASEFFSCKIQKSRCIDAEVSFGDCSDPEKKLEHCIKDEVDIWIPGESEGSSSSSGAAGSGGSSGASGSGGAG